jgi:hypothetical protein
VLPRDLGVTPVPPSACPRCGAVARRGAQWCTLCYTDLRAPVRAVPEPELVSVPETRAAEAGRPDSAVSVAQAAGAGRGKHARRDPTETNVATVSGRGARGSVADDELGTEAMLALLAAESRKPLSGIAGRLDSTASRVGLMAGGMVVIAALLFLVMAVLGSLL